MDASVRGVAKPLGGEKGSIIPVIVGKQFTRIDTDGTFEVSGLNPECRYEV